MIFSHIWAWSCSWQNSYIKNKCGVPVYIFVWGPAKRIQNPKHVLWSIRTGKNETWSLRQCIPSLSAQRRNEIRRRRPTKAPVCCSTFAEQGPMGNSTAITAQYCMCLNSCTGEEILNTGIHARRHVPSTEAWSNPHERTHAHTHTHFIHRLGHQIYAPFPGRRTLLSHRHSSLGFHSAIWCLAKASFVTDCVLKRLYDQNLCGPEEFKFLCGKKDCGGVHHGCISVCAQTSAQQKGHSHCWTSTGGEHTLAQDPRVKHWLRGRHSE